MNPTDLINLAQHHGWQIAANEPPHIVLVGTGQRTAVITIDLTDQTGRSVTRTPNPTLRRQDCTIPLPQPPATRRTLHNDHDIQHAIRTESR